MPNWCVGTLKVRGEKENLRRFMLEALEPVTGLPSILANGIKAEKEIDEDEYEISIRANNSRAFHIKGTRRNFIDSNSLYWHKDRNVLLLDDFEAAWGIDVEGLAGLSKEFDIDIRIYGFEKGMEFNQDVEIHKGAVIRNNEIQFDDYDWECVMPRLGG